MSHAYTPGLKVKSKTIVRKSRTLPVEGKVLVEKGERVTHDTIVARAIVPGDIKLVNVAKELGVDPEVDFIESYLVRKKGEIVQKDEPIAISKGIFGLFRSECISPVTGTIEMISDITGRVGVRLPPVSVEVRAYLPGTVVEIMPNSGVVVETTAAFVQGIFGIGGETHGEIKLVAESSSDTLTPEAISSDCSGKVLIGGGLVTEETIRKAMNERVKAIVVGGMHDDDLSRLLGREIGVGITGQEEVGLSLIITEGFGKMTMSSGTFRLLKSLEGMLAAVNGATQIRAGVLRPEIIVPLGDERAGVLEVDRMVGGMDIGTPVRVIRDPYFGAVGRVANLPVELAKVPTGSEVRVVEIELEDGERVTLPRANVEIIEE